MREMLRCVIIVGTRPDAIKLAPLVLACRDKGHEAILLSTGQHPAMTRGALQEFALVPDEDLGIHRGGLGLTELIGVMLPALDRALRRLAPHAVVVQGDTATALSGALAASHLKLPVIHVEAGLRSGVPDAPFPEERYRRLIAQLAQLHCAPAEGARLALLQEGIADDDILVSGNTVIDAMRLMGAFDEKGRPRDILRKLVLITSHRRENWGKNYSAICEAAAKLSRIPSLRVVLVQHPNAVQHAESSALNALSASKAEIIGPQSYRSFLDLLRQAYVVLTDSGGVQEEAAALGRPALVLRDQTERLEGVAFGTSRIVGTRAQTVLDETRRLLNNEALHECMSRPCQLYGDGFAATRIVCAMAQRFARVSDERGGESRQRERNVIGAN